MADLRGIEGQVMLRGLELYVGALDRAGRGRADVEWHSTGHLDMTSVPGLGPGWMALSAVEPWRG